MGIYVINRDAMIKLLREHFPEANGLKSEVIPGAISLGMKVRLHSNLHDHALSVLFLSR